jgi:YidC/Oxa1 family membrane protein insertase
MPNLAVFTSVFSQVLLAIYSVTSNLGWTILAFTALVRALLLPLTVPSLKAQKAIQSLQPEVAALKKKHGKDAKAFQAAQMELYKKYNVNPLAGCIPQLVQIVILILLYQALIAFLKQDQINGIVINPNFLWLNLSIPDPKFVIPVLAAVSQLILSVMLLPATEVRDIVPNNSKNKKIKEENKKEEDVADMAQSMQQQMLFIMPLMTGFFALRFPSGLGLYWIATTVLSIIQQYFISGPGGLTTYVGRVRLFLKNRAGSQTA